MNLLDHLRCMAGNNLWSNDRLYRAVLALEPGEFEAERTSFFPSIKATLNHILAVDLLYLDFLEEGGIGAAAHDDYVPFDEPRALFAAQLVADRRLIAFCDALSEADLDRRVITDRREDGMIPERIGDILAHVFLHDIHHRGQVHAMLSGTSVAPPQLDEFLLDYDLKLRKTEVERLGLDDQTNATS
ncbi:MULTISPECIES: DinB family protein [Mesorhizobium]|uniref:DinB family protein n=1 Tax=Mesorhizobium opportunistum (strain LMG 24607 / HAMBI 3007 / WSM2075) TaxID=536019 RepID=F7Y2G6_MESOW|nr:MULTISPECIES: DinB family protein [Mesorhizobium]AEH89435.1 DinB family protein [Mesorhizobium opportunistum WSM2075]MCA0033509.1 DinB family protein [Mesorhizobium sp. B263B2A]